MSSLERMSEHVSSHLREIPAERTEVFDDLRRRLFDRMETVCRERIAPRREK